MLRANLMCQRLIFAIADEAHKTTGAKKQGGDEERLFQLIHNETAIRAEMRLYMTATPRVYSNKAQLNAKGFDVTDMGSSDIYRCRAGSVELPRRCANGPPAL